MKTKIVIFLIILAIGPFVALAIMSATAKAPDNLGAKDGKLSACGDSPNCVCSCDERESHSIEPIAYEASSAFYPMQSLALIVRDMRGAKIVEQTNEYLYATFSSEYFRFIDDVEFLVDRENQQFLVRSASRAGYSDMGVNRQRIETIRDAVLGQAGFPKRDEEEGDSSEATADDEEKKSSSRPAASTRIKPESSDAAGEKDEQDDAAAKDSDNASASHPVTGNSGENASTADPHHGDSHRGHISVSTLQRADGKSAREVAEESAAGISDEEPADSQ